MEAAFVGFTLAKVYQFLSLFPEAWIDLHQQTANLKRELRALQAFAENVQNSTEFMDTAHKLILMQIRSVIYKAEDMVDKKRTFTEKVKSIIKKELKDISTEISTIRTNERSFLPNECNRRESVKRKKNIGDSRRNVFFSDNKPIGFDERKKELLHKLEEKSLISIVGMGGSGKTTLARMVYDSFTSDTSFACRCLVKLSKDDDANKIIKKLGMELKMKTRNADDDEWRKVVHEHLDGKTYLIFFDDVWDELTWKTIVEYLPRTTMGSKVLITTRSYKVARVNKAYQGDLYELKMLDDAKSLELFKNHAPNMVEPDDELEKIVKKCCGLPLAITVLARLLSTNYENDWRRFIIMLEEERDRRRKVRGIRWEDDAVANQCLDILALSYNDLNNELKCCFLYFSCFPDDELIDVNKLMRLWIAEEFVRPLNDNEQLERAAYNRLMDLIDRSLIQVEHVNECGVVQTCRIHDMLLELAVSRAGWCGFSNVCLGKRTDNKDQVRRLTLQRGSMKNYVGQHDGRRLKRLKTLLCFAYCDVDYSSYKFLRVLYLKTTSSSLSGIEHLDYLKYLEVHGDKLSKLPSSIDKLEKLETLDIKESLIKELPEEVWTIEKLRHVRGTDLSVKKMGNNLVDLLTLDGLQIGSWINKEKMENLLVLKLSGAANGQRQPCPLPELPENLKEISLSRISLSPSSWKALGNLRSLEIFRLCDGSYVEQGMTCGDESFSELKAFVLKDLGGQRIFNVEARAMKKLKVLKIINCERICIPEVLRERQEDGHLQVDVLSSRC